jgi:hypothetical protein
MNDCAGLFWGVANKELALEVMRCRGHDSLSLPATSPLGWNCSGCNA